MQRCLRCEVQEEPVDSAAERELPRIDRQEILPAELARNSSSRHASVGSAAMAVDSAVQGDMAASSSMQGVGPDACMQPKRKRNLLQKVVRIARVVL